MRSPSTAQRYTVPALGSATGSGASARRRSRKAGVEQLRRRRRRRARGRAPSSRASLRGDHSRRQVGRQPSSSPSASSATTPCVGGGSSSTWTPRYEIAERVDPARAVGREVLLVEPAGRRDRPRDADRCRRPGRRRFAIARRLCGELREADALARSRQRPELGRRAALGPQVGGHGGRARSPARPRRSRLRDTHRARDGRVAPRARPSPRPHPGPSPTGGRARPRARGARPRRGGPGRVETLGLPVPPDDREAVAADPGRHRLGDRQHGRRGDARRRPRCRRARASAGRRGSRAAGSSPPSRWRRPPAGGRRRSGTASRDRTAPEPSSAVGRDRSTSMSAC